MALTDAQNLSYLRDPLETEEDAQDVIDAMEAFERVGRRIDTREDGERYQQILAELRAQRPTAQK